MQKRNSKIEQVIDAIVQCDSEIVYALQHKVRKKEIERNENMKKIVVTEKPLVAREYAKVLGVEGNHDGYIENDEWIITWCVGHLVTLSYPEAYDPDLKEWKDETLPFLPKQYKYEVIANVRKQFNTVKQLYNRSDISTIYFAGDSGREGIYIQALVRNAAGHTNGIDERVVWIDSQTEEEILNGIRDAKPYSAYSKMIASGYERAIEDYATGINFSRMLSIRYGHLANNYAATKKYRPIAVGRVMTCVLGMIVDREREIENFHVTPFYKIHNTLNGIDAEWKAVSSSRMYNSSKLYSDTGFKDDADCKEFIRTLPSCIKIEKLEKKIEKKGAPFLFNLAELQGECTKRFKISPDETLQIAQSLYEKKLTTYPRTDSRVLSTAVAMEIGKNLSGLANGYTGDCAQTAQELVNKQAFKDIARTKYTDDSKVTDHYAIIPTGSGYSSLNGLSDLEKNVFDLIVRRFLSIFMPPAEYQTVKMTEDAGGEKFFASAKVLLSPGYMEIAGLPANDKKADISVFNSLAEGQEYAASYSTKKGETAPPKRYTSGSMVLVMENAGNLIEDEELRAQIKSTGIGTSATRAEIIKKLITLEYISLNKKTQILTPAPLGNIIYEIVAHTIPDLLNPKMTASWEKGLDGIYSGEITCEAYRANLEDYVRKEIEKIRNESDTEGMLKGLERYKNKNAFVSKELDIPCPVCGGKIKTTTYGCLCSNYKKDATAEELCEKKACNFGIGQIAGKQLSEKEITELLRTGKSPLLKGFKGKSGKPFDARLKLIVDRSENGVPVPKLSFLFNEPEKTDILCPECNKPLIITKFGYGCSSYKSKEDPGCGFFVPVEICGYKLNTTDVKELVLNGILKGKTFISKQKKKFTADLKLMKQDGKYSAKFEFPEQQEEQSKIPCPKCGKMLMKGKWNYECKDCGYKISHSVAKKEIPEKEMKDLILGKQTDMIKGFTSKAGKKFNACLKADENGKISFVFD